MTAIRILPEILSNKIAAGEVVERPSSVVKELTENALDAGGSRIIIEVEKGGRSLIRVSDNGSGMLPDDALLSIERYATSKIYRQEDLFAIKTLGFRGEALPSIASVSRFSLITRHQSSDAGTEIMIDGGRIIKVSEIGAPIGTSVAVKQLFFNTPARRKFLKQIPTEMGHIADIVSGMALGHPSVQFRLFHNGRLVKDWIRVTDVRERVADVLGKELHKKLYPVRYQDDHVTLSGWIASPEITRATSRSIYIYINGRTVKDRVIQHALHQGYAGRVMKGQFPLGVLFLQVPHDALDVNVHPTKNEVRFARQKQVHAAVQQAVSAALKLTDSIQWGREIYPADRGGRKFRKSRFAGHPDKRLRAFVTYGARKNSESEFQGVTEQPAHTALPEDPGKPSQEAFHETAATGTPGNDLLPHHDPKTSDSQATLWRRKRFSDLKVIGQFQDVYILCEAGEDLVLIDQHAAHERIMYEHLKKRSHAAVESQGLLIPETIDLSYREAGVLEKMIADLAALGLKVEHFGGQTYVVQAVPALFNGGEVKPLIKEIVEKWIEDGSDVTAKALDDTLKIMACHGAVRANQRLAGAEITALLKQLDACENPSNCPHGRPTWIRLDRRFIEKSFKRIV